MTEQLKPRISKIIEALSDGLYEREETVAVTLLAALSGQASFLYGKPGTAKSLIARRIAQAFQGAKHFEYLMQKFSTPEEVFGPVSIHELKNDKYIRKTDGYLPCADIAFLDEIWKSSPAILNTLLTIINERVFRNGAVESKVPLKALIAASNETPPANQGLDALYDRFVVRLLVSPLEDRKNFERLLQDVPIEASVSLPESIRLTHDEWRNHRKAIPRVTIPAEVLSVINAIKCQLTEFNDKNPDKKAYVSDRRWQNISQLLKAAAYFCDRDQVLAVDLLILRHCLWTLESNREQISDMVENCIKQFGHPSRGDLEKWEANHSELEKQVSEVFFHADNVLITENIRGEECLPFTVTFNRDRHGFEVDSYVFYAPTKHMKTAKMFYPLKRDGAIDKRLQCSFAQNVLVILMDKDVKNHGMESSYTSGEFVDFGKVSPPLSFVKGTQKQVAAKVKQTYQTETQRSFREINRLFASAETFCQQQQHENDTPFVPSEKRSIVLSALQNHIEELKNHQLNAEHLCEKVNIHAYTLTSNQTGMTGVPTRRPVANDSVGPVAV